MGCFIPQKRFVGRELPGPIQPQPSPGAFLEQISAQTGQSWEVAFPQGILGGKNEEPVGFPTEVMPSAKLGHSRWNMGTPEVLQDGKCAWGSPPIRPWIHPEPGTASQTHWDETHWNTPTCSSNDAALDQQFQRQGWRDGWMQRGQAHPGGN